MTNSQKNEVNHIQVTDKTEMGDAFKGSPMLTALVDEAPTEAKNRRKEINTVDLCETKRVKMKLVILIVGWYKRLDTNFKDRSITLNLN